MEELTVKLRYFPLDPVAAPPNPIRTDDLKKIAGATGTQITLENIVNKSRTVQGDIMREDTMDSHIEEVSQDVITVSAGDEKSMRAAIGALFKLYRAPRTVFGTWGSSPGGRELVLRVCDEEGDGWY
jgi:hypothetical protein